MRNIILSLLLILTAAASLPAQDIDAISARIDLQRTEFPQEKIHVMTDQGSYLAGDTIWLRAWVVDAASHQPVNASQFVYAELVSPIDSVIARVKIHPDANGVFRGYLFKGHAFDNRHHRGRRQRRHPLPHHPPGDQTLNAPALNSREVG